MKKINVSKLVELREREQSILKSLRLNNFDFQRKSLENQLAEVREQFAIESEALSGAIAEVEGPRVSVRKIDAKDIANDLIEINEYLGISKKAMKGTSVHVDHNAQSFPGSYKGTPESTQFDAEFTTGWFITAIGRDTCIRRKYQLKMSESAKEAYLLNAETLA